MLDDTKNRKLYQEVLVQINEIIKEDDLKVGDRLPSERELAERLNVGRSSVREALRALELLGLISTRHGEGTFIEESTSHHLVEILAFFILRDQKSKKDLLEMRKIIELDAVRLAAERMKKEQIQKIERLLDKTEQRIKSGLLPVQEDFLFHQYIALATNNYLLYRIWRSIIDFGRTILKDSLERHGRSEISIQEHRYILEALKMKDREEAERRMKMHLEKSQFFA
ncbi:FadR/GntR family transcriptional regulator [Tepidibacillus fermentans]|uniref:GntR family transcriptional regulator n=1 Tax=Tepidibacillus fermentans TaxID=1281767 RepID=A0A4R3KJ60_9BACI|nr:FadR/GntR family transcriptional regulator [Tepidibacillus fermentans]TCS83586.1 GntR family transcriptional regulator [Tepidibacillus fermentans]